MSLAGQKSHRRAVDPAVNRYESTNNAFSCREPRRRLRFSPAALLRRRGATDCGQRTEAAAALYQTVQFSLPGLVPSYTMVH
jgi:hypothetical protein